MNPLWHRMGKFWNSTFACNVQWCMTICHKLFSISWGPFENVNLLFFVLKMQIWNLMKNINVNLSFLSLGSNVVEWLPPWPNMRMFWHSSFAHTMQWCMTICHKLFSISWGPFENVNLPFFVLKMQIWNPMKNINVNLSFLSLGSNVVEWLPPWPNMRIFWYSSFACTVQWCMKICHKLFPSAEGHLKMLIYFFLYWKCRFETPWNISMYIFHFSVYNQKLWNGPPDPTWECFEILLLHGPSNDAWQFPFSFFPSVEGHWKMLIYHFSIENVNLKWL